MSMGSSLSASNIRINSNNNNITHNQRNDSNSLSPLIAVNRNSPSSTQPKRPRTSLVSTLRRKNEKWISNRNRRRSSPLKSIDKQNRQSWIDWFSNSFGHYSNDPFVVFILFFVTLYLITLIASMYLVHSGDNTPDHPIVHPFISASRNHANLNNGASSLQKHPNRYIYV